MTDEIPSYEIDDELKAKAQAIFPIRTQRGQDADLEQLSYPGKGARI